MAQDVQSMVSPSCKLKDSDVIQRFITTYQVTKSILDKSGRDMYQVIAKTEQATKDLGVRLHFHKNVAMAGMKRTIELGYTDVWRRLVENYLNMLTQDARQVMFQFEKSLKQLQFSAITDMTLARMFHLMGDTSLSVKMDIAVETLENTTKLYYAYINGEPNIVEEITPEKRYDLSLIPYSVFSEQSYIYQRYYGDLTSKISDYIENIVKLKRIIRNTLSTRTYNITEKNVTRNLYFDLTVGIEKARKNFQEHVVDTVEALVRNKINRVINVNESFLRSQEKLNEHIMSVDSYLTWINLNVMGELTDIVNCSYGFFRHSNVSKKGLIHTFLEIDLEGLLSRIDSAIFELSLYYREILKLLSHLHNDVISIWHLFFHEDLLKNFYIRLKNDVSQMKNNARHEKYLYKIFAHKKMLNLPPYNQSSKLSHTFWVLLNADVPVMDYQVKVLKLNQTFAELTDLIEQGDLLRPNFKTFKRVLQETHDYFQEAKARIQLGKNFVK